MEENQTITIKNNILKYTVLITTIVILLISSGFIAARYQVWDLKNYMASIPEPTPSGPIIPVEQLIKIPIGTCPDAYNGRYFTLNGQAIDSEQKQTDWINANCKNIQRENIKNSEELAVLSPNTCPDGRDGNFFTLKGKKIDLYGQELQWVNDNCSVGGANLEKVGQPIVMTPFEIDSEIGDIWVYCKTLANGCPRSDVHTGLDFITNKNLAAIRSVVTGIVTKVELYKNSYPDPNNPTYQVNVEISYDSTYGVAYHFEPMTHNKTDAEYQMSLMKIKPGVKVQQSWRIGNLLMKGENAHIHLDFYKDGEPICPEKYFSETALGVIMPLIQKNYPGRKMCY